MSTLVRMYIKELAEGRDSLTNREIQQIIELIQLIDVEDTIEWGKTLWTALSYEAVRASDEILRAFLPTALALADSANYYTTQCMFDYLLPADLVHEAVDQILEGEDDSRSAQLSIILEGENAVHLVERLPGIVGFVPLGDALRAAWRCYGKILDSEHLAVMKQLLSAGALTPPWSRWWGSDCPKEPTFEYVHELLLFCAEYEGKVAVPQKEHVAGQEDKVSGVKFREVTTRKANPAVKRAKNPLSSASGRLELLLAPDAVTIKQLLADIKATELKGGQRLKALLELKLNPNIQTITQQILADSDEDMKKLFISALGLGNLIEILLVLETPAQDIARLLRWVDYYRAWKIASSICEKLGRPDVLIKLLGYSEVRELNETQIAKYLKAQDLSPVELNLFFSLLESATPELTLVDIQQLVKASLQTRS